MINFIVAIDPFTFENGATRLIPGSHNWSRDRRPKIDEVKRALLNPGDALAYRGSLLHAGGANTTDRPRLGAVLSYSLGIMRQAENQYLAVPTEKACQLPERVQRLMGYQLQRPNLGWVENNDPILLLQGLDPSKQPPRDNGTKAQTSMLATLTSSPSLAPELFF